MFCQRESKWPFCPEQGTTMCRTAALGAAVILLFTSRACYNLTVLFLSQSHRVESFNYDWYNVSDQVTVVTRCQNYCKLASDWGHSYTKEVTSCVFALLQADLHSELGDKGYLAFGAILFIWELLPTGLLIIIFRVRQPAQEVVTTSALTLDVWVWNHGSNLEPPLMFFFLNPWQTNAVVINNRVLPRPYFFDDPQASDDDLPVPWARSPNLQPR